MSNDLRDLKLMFEALLSTEPWRHDRNVLPIPWRRDEELRVQRHLERGKLFLGVMEDDGVVVPQPPIARALRMVKDALRGEGHDVRETFQVQIPQSNHRRSYAGTLLPTQGLLRCTFVNHYRLSNEQC